MGVTVLGIQHRVALRKESVDRNRALEPTAKRLALSLSARRAWIEIDSLTDDVSTGGSLSARRAWIEMMSVCE